MQCDNQFGNIEEEDLLVVYFPSSQKLKYLPFPKVELFFKQRLNLNGIIKRLFCLYFFLISSKFFLNKSKIKKQNIPKIQTAFMHFTFIQFL